MYYGGMLLLLLHRRDPSLVSPGGEWSLTTLPTTCCVSEEREIISKCGFGGSPRNEILLVEIHRGAGTLPVTPEIRW